MGSALYSYSIESYIFPGASIASDDDDELVELVADVVLVELLLELDCAEDAEIEDFEIFEISEIFGDVDDAIVGDELFDDVIFVVEL